MNMIRFLTILLLLLISSYTSGKEPTAKEIEFFENKIRPVLAEQCYRCHNSVDKAKGDIALDYRKALLDSEVIVPGKPEESLLIQALRHDEDVEAMPFKAPKLAKLIVKNFEDWIRMGTPDPRLKKPTEEDLHREVDWDAVRDSRAKWWSFQPIVNHPVPKVDAKEWNHTAIDRFIKARLQIEGLEPQSVAEPEALIRRLHLVLIGRPPSPEVVSEYIDAPSPEAYDAIVDRLLASKEFGERWGRYWLDWFRFAESYGSEGDPLIPFAKEYRDYVIRALNQDVPYDQLLREHIAGDLLESPRVNEELGVNESAIGPGFLRMVPHGFGVTDAYDEQITFTDNQVDVTSKAILGLTVSCARCHNHKFDPISQKDFYKFYGLMISSRPAIIEVDSPKVKKHNREELRDLKVKIRQQMADFWLNHIDQVMSSLENPTKVKALAEEAKRETHPFSAWFKLKDLKAEKIQAEWKELHKRYRQRLSTNKERISQATFYADLREQKTYDRWFKKGRGLSDKIAPAGSFSVIPDGDSVFKGIYPRGVYSHLITDKDNAILHSVFHKAKGNYTAIRGMGEGAIGRFLVRSYPLEHGLHPTRELPRNASWFRVNKYKYWNDEKLYYQISTRRERAGRFINGGDRSWFGVYEVYAGSQPLEEVGTPAVSLPGSQKTPKDQDSLKKFYKRAITNALRSWRRGSMADSQAQLLETLRKQGLLSDKLGSLPPAIKTLIERYRKLESEIKNPRRAPGVMEGEPWDQALLVQGNYKKEAEPVKRGFLEVFGDRVYTKAKSARIQLVEDLLSEKNTLTQRVIVNRLWHHTFGRGLVGSTDNLGRLGEEPSHPELLDWLAHQLRKDGWSLKRMIRLMVRSRAFKSKSQSTPEVQVKDPKNRWLTYYTPRRLDAEAILDTINYVSGNSEGRAIYRQVRRNNLNSFLTTFNFPIPTTTVGVRDSTNVPAQSLTLMNGEIVLRAARRWADRLSAGGGLENKEKLIVRAFKEAFSRSPTSEELAACVEFLKDDSDDGALQKLSQEVEASLKKLNGLEKRRNSILDPVRERLKEAQSKKNSKVVKSSLDLKPMAFWDFEKDAKDQIGSMHGRIAGRAKIEGGVLHLNGGCVFTEAVPKNINEKTFEVLIQLDRLNQRGGGAMTLQDLRGRDFDSIVYAEVDNQRWLSGSENHRRYRPFGGPADSEVGKRPVRLIMVYKKDGTTQLYRDGQPYGRSYRAEGLKSFRANQSQIVFGLRHGTGPGGGRSLTGKIFEARLYDRALTEEEVQFLSSGEGNFITERQVREALETELLKKVEQLDEQISSSRRLKNKLQKELNESREQASRTLKGLSRLTHALLNSRELIYVH